MNYVALVIIVFFVTFGITIVTFYKFFASIFRKISQLFSTAFNRISDGVSSVGESVSDAVPPSFPDIEKQINDFFSGRISFDDLPENSEGIVDENAEPKAEKDGLKIQLDLSGNFTNSIKNQLETAFDYVLNSEFLRRNFKKLVLKIHEFNRELDRELHPEFYEKFNNDKSKSPKKS